MIRTPLSRTGQPERWPVRQSTAELGVVPCVQGHVGCCVDQRGCVEAGRPVLSSRCSRRRFHAFSLSLSRTCRTSGSCTDHLEPALRPGGHVVLGCSGQSCLRWKEVGILERGKCDSLEIRLLEVSVLMTSCKSPQSLLSLYSYCSYEYEYEYCLYCLYCIHSVLSVLILVLLHSTRL